jgi:hypothetical protein
MLGSFAVAPPSIAVTEARKQPLTGALSVSQHPEWPLPPNVKQLKKHPNGVELYQFDTTPVGNRAPLLMVHGLLGEYWDTFRWRKLLTHLQKDPAFTSRYKVILARYDTHAQLKDVVPSFKEQALKVSEAFGGQPLSVVALSLGGNVVQDAMRDAAFEKHVKSVMTFGTPFHGSPLFTTNWMEYSMLRHYHSPVSRLDTALPYRLYFNRHKNLVSDLRWDNTDRMIPDVGKFRFFFPLATRGVLSGPSTGNQTVADWNKPGEVDKSKFTVYAGYLLTDYADNKSPNEIKQILKVPYRFTFTLLPEHLGREHPVLRALNLHIARAITSQAHAAGPIKYAYGLNDGIAPLVSSLYLPSERLPGLVVSPANLSSLKELADVKRARVFKNIDHLTFIDDYHPLGASEILRDELNTSESAKPIFDWIKQDLLSDN